MDPLTFFHRKRVAQVTIKLFLYVYRVFISSCFFSRKILNLSRVFERPSLNKTEIHSEYSDHLLFRDRNLPLYQIVIKNLLIFQISLTLYRNQEFSKIVLWYSACGCLDSFSQQVPHKIIKTNLATFPNYTLSSISYYKVCPELKNEVS